MSDKRQSVEDIAKAFTDLADSEGTRIPMYARLCRIIADDPELAGLLLEAPIGQRLPVLLLAALHDVVLRETGAPISPWFPSVTVGHPSNDDPTAALYDTIDRFRGEILDLLRTRQVQTNEVNRCVAWWLALHDLCAEDPRPLSLVEVGASAGLNLRLADYAYEITGAGVDDRIFANAESTVRLGTEIRTGSWPRLGAELPPAHTCIGLDRRPLVVLDESDARWLRACVWPEQRIRFERLEAALARARVDPPTVVTGDLVDDLDPILASRPNGTHVVVLVSWVLAYVRRQDRERFADRLTEASARIESGGGRLTLLSLEAENVLPWMEPPPRPPAAASEIAFASILAATSFVGGVPDAHPIARCQAHLVWCDRLG